jgi:hypothetical protein
MKFSDDYMEIPTYDRYYSGSDIVLAVEMPIDYIPREGDDVVIVTNTADGILEYPTKIKQAAQAGSTYFIMPDNIKRWMIHISDREGIVTMPVATSIRFLFKD